MVVKYLPIFLLLKRSTGYRSWIFVPGHCFHFNARCALCSSTIKRSGSSMSNATTTTIRRLTMTIRRLATGIGVAESVTTSYTPGMIAKIILLMNTSRLDRLCQAGIHQHHHILGISCHPNLYPGFLIGTYLYCGPYKLQYLMISIEKLSHETHVESAILPSQPSAS